MYDVFKEIWALAIARKKAFLLPLMMVLLIVGGLLVLAESSVVAPFLYALF